MRVTHIRKNRVFPESFNTAREKQLMKLESMTYVLCVMTFYEKYMRLFELVATYLESSHT